jgi:hypothetical protein
LLQVGSSLLLVLALCLRLLKIASIPKPLFVEEKLDAFLSTFPHPLKNCDCLLGVGGGRWLVGCWVGWLLMLGWLFRKGLVWLIKRVFHTLVHSNGQLANPQQPQQTLIIVAWSVTVNKQRSNKRKSKDKKKKKKQVSKYIGKRR